jgi:PadR family transcriptional regulator PadR
METMLTARAAILQALIEGPAYGLEVIDRVHARSGGKFGVHQGSAYPVLRTLEAEGLVRSWEGDPSEARGGRPRRYYELTAEGLRSAREQRELLLTFLAPAVAR